MSVELIQEVIEVVNDLLYEYKHARRLDKETFNTLDVVKNAYDIVDKLYKEWEVYNVEKRTNGQNRV